MRRRAAWSWRTPPRTVGSGWSTRARSCESAWPRSRAGVPRDPARPRAGCNAMARPVFGRQERTTEVVVALDRDRPAVEAARRDPAQFDALYRKYLPQVYAYALYELGDHHAAEDATERTFLRALAALPRFREQARPEIGRASCRERV